MKDKWWFSENDMKVGVPEIKYFNITPNYNAWNKAFDYYISIVYKEKSQQG